MYLGDRGMVSDESRHVVLVETASEQNIPSSRNQTWTNHKSNMTLISEE